jgi:GNAT superfamily N-acetyltransferase
MTQPLPKVVIQIAETPTDIAHVRTLMREYGDHLAANPTGAASICLVDSDTELARLPGPYTLFLAMVEGDAAGCVAVKPIRAAGAPYGENAMELKRLWVRGAHRGLGLGRRLMQGAIDRAASLGCDAIYLDTVPAAMPEANALYAAMGFIQVERYNDNPLNDVVFFRRGLE